MPTITKEQKSIPVKTFPRRYGLILITSAFMILGYPWWARNSRNIMGEDFVDARAAYVERRFIPNLVNSTEYISTSNGWKEIVYSQGITFGVYSTSNIITKTNYYVNLNLKIEPETDSIFATFINGTNTIIMDRLVEEPSTYIRIFNNMNLPPSQGETNRLIVSGFGLTEIVIPIHIRPYGNAQPSILETNVTYWGLAKEHSLINMSHYSKVFNERIYFKAGDFLYPETHWDQVSNIVTSVTNLFWVAQDAEYLDSAHIEKERMITLFESFRNLTTVYDWVEPEEFIQSAVPVFGWKEHSWTFTNTEVYSSSPLPFDSPTNGNVYSLINTESVSHVTFMTSKTMLRNSQTGKYPIYPNLWYNEPQNRPVFGDFPFPSFTNLSPIEMWVEYWESNDISNIICFQIPDMGSDRVKSVLTSEVSKVFEGKGNWWSTIPGSLGMFSNCYIYPSLEKLTNTLSYDIEFTNEPPYFVTNWYTEYNIKYNPRITTNTFQELMEVAKKLNATLHEASQISDDQTILYEYSSIMSDGTNAPYENSSDWFADAQVEDSTQVYTNNTISSFFSDNVSLEGTTSAWEWENTSEYSKDGRIEVSSGSGGSSEFSGSIESRREKITGLMLSYPSLFALTNGYVSEVWIYAVVKTSVIEPLATCAPQEYHLSWLEDNMIGVPIEKYTRYEDYFLTPTGDTTPLSDFTVPGYDCCEHDFPEGFIRNQTQKDEIYDNIPYCKIKLNLVKHVVDPKELIRFDFGIDSVSLPFDNFQTVSAIEESHDGYYDYQTLIQDEEGSNYVTETHNYISMQEYTVSSLNNSAYPEFWVMVKWNWKHMNPDNIYKPEEYQPVWYTNSYDKLIHPYTNNPSSTNTP